MLKVNKITAQFNIHCYFINIDNSCQELCSILYQKNIIKKVNNDKIGKIKFIINSLRDIFNFSMSNGSDNSSYGGEAGDITYTVSFNGNGAESGSIDSINAKYNQQVFLPDNTFVKTGYRFTPLSAQPASSLKWSI